MLGPRGPLSPLSPFGPCAPAGPFVPCAPCAPWGPAGPCFPVPETPRTPRGPRMFHAIRLRPDRARDFRGELGSLGRRRSDADAVGLQRFLLALGGSRRAGDDRA